MDDTSRSYSIIKLHDRSELCWGVIDARGALLNFNGLSMRLSRDEAQIIADDRNRRADSENVGAPFAARYSGAELQRIEEILRVCRVRIERQRATISTLDEKGYDARTAHGLLAVFSDITKTYETARQRIVDYFHSLPDARGDPIFTAVKRARDQVSD